MGIDLQITHKALLSALFCIVINGFQIKGASDTIRCFFRGIDRKLECFSSRLMSAV